MNWAERSNPAEGHTLMSMRDSRLVRVAPAIVLVAVVTVGGVIAGRSNRGRQALRSAISLTGGGMDGLYYGGMDEYLPPASLAEMVEYSSEIVVARYESIVDLGFYALITPLPPDLVTPGAILPPVPGFDMVETTFTVVSVLKSERAMTAGQSITTQSGGTVPKGGRDTTRPFPLVWPRGTEFILFLGWSEGGPEPSYYITGRCGRVLTDGRDVTCSDSRRSSLPFMEGFDRDAFIGAIEAEVADPSPTEIPYPWPTHSAEPPEPTEFSEVVAPDPTMFFPLKQFPTGTVVTQVPPTAGSMEPPETPDL